MLSEKVKKRVAFWTLLLMVPFLTELLSGNTPLPKFINPMVFGYFVVMYGFPVLLAREAFVAKGLSWGGLLVLGLAYGVLNEGVAARTLLLSDEHMFMESIRGYETFGVNVPWAMMILPWHALLSVVYPIMLMQAAYPESRGQRWLSNRTCIGLASAVIILGSLSYFGTELYPATSPAYLIFFWLLIVGLVGLVWTIKRDPREIGMDQPASRSPILPFVFGMSLIMLMIVPLVLPVLGVPEFLQTVISGLLIAGSIGLFSRYFLTHEPDRVRVALGHYGISSLFMVFALGLIGLAGAAIVWAILWSFWRLILRNEARLISQP
jgi:hypothetical protein